MLFPEEDTQQLKKWIVKRLENTSDADPDVLADYVVALLRHNGDIETVRRLCEEEIPDFLKEGSSIFISDVFDALKYRSYIPGAPLPPKPSAHLITPPAGPSSIIPGFLNTNITGISRGPQNVLRKRSYNDREELDSPDGRNFQHCGDINGRFFKQARRSSDISRGGRFDSGGTGRGLKQGQPSPMQMPISGFSNLPAIPSPPPGIPPLDPNNPMAALLAMQTMGFHLPGMSPFPQATSPLGQSGSPAPVYSTHKKAQRCRDYDTKGFCARGNTCMYEHGTDSIYMPPNIVEEYDPHNSLMTAIDHTSASPTVATPLSSNFDSSRGNDRGKGRGKIQRGDRVSSNGGPSRRGGRAEFSSDRPNFDRTNTTIVVENIPEERFSEDVVREFFAEFGSITEVSMRPYRRLALVKYDDWSAAKAAYSSPKVIFDNRFVKVYWYTNPDSLSQGPLATNRNEASNNVNGTSSPATARATSESRIDLEEFTRKQQEAQKVHEEKMKKKSEMEAAQKELERRQEELLKKQAEEKRKLMEKLAAKSSKLGTSSITERNGTKAASNGKPGSQTEALKAQLAALEAEAKSLGLDTALTDDTAWSSRGRGRGRGAYRGRGAFIPRGGYRGRGTTAFGGAATSYKLDNRPKKISLTGIDFTDPEKDESLRQYLLGIGDFANIETTPECTFITFKDRFTAEKFMYGTSNGEIPSTGKVELAWVQTPVPPVDPSTSSLGVSKMEKHDEMKPGEGDATMQVSTTIHGDGQRQEHHQDLDYDVADDNDWGIS